MVTNCTEAGTSWECLVFNEFHRGIHRVKAILHLPWTRPPPQTERERIHSRLLKGRLSEKENIMTLNRKSFALTITLTALQTAFAATSHRPAAQYRPLPSPVGPFAIVVTTNGDFVNPISQLGVLDLGTGFFNPVSTLDSPPVGIARDVQGVLYGVDYSNNLGLIQPLTGKTIVVGSTGLSKAGPIGPAVDVFASLPNGELFLMDYDNVLYSVNKNTGAATMIGATGIPSITTPFYGTSFSGGCDGLYFTVEEDDENGNNLIPAALYRIDPRTAVTTKVGPTASFMGGSGFIGGRLYGFKIDEALVGGTLGPEVLDIQLNSGSTQVVSNLNVPSVFGAVSINDESRGCRAPR
jgi:hypothetical protein